MAFAGFHPVVRQWFTTEVGEPTSAQRRGWESIAAGRHTLSAAPTGSGKTTILMMLAGLVLSLTAAVVGVWGVTRRDRPLHGPVDDGMLGLPRLQRWYRPAARR